MRDADDPFRPEHFQREDESPDPLFYVRPRLVAHIDDAAIEAARRFYAELLPSGGALLDLMSSWRSHMPAELGWRRLAGIGLNEVELRENGQLTEFAVKDLNADPTLPYGDAEFDGAVVTVSVQYMTRPVELFREVARVLRPGAPFAVTYSDRMFPTKAMWIWRALGWRGRAGLIASYFKRAGGFGEVRAQERAGAGAGHDPLYAVWALRDAW